MHRSVELPGGELLRGRLRALLLRVEWSEASAAHSVWSRFQHESEPPLFGQLSLLEAGSRRLQRCVGVQVVKAHNRLLGGHLAAVDGNHTRCVLDVQGGRPVAEEAAAAALRRVSGAGRLVSCDRADVIKVQLRDLAAL